MPLSVQNEEDDEFGVQWSSQPAVCGKLSLDPMPLSVRDNEDDEIRVKWSSQPAECGGPENESDEGGYHEDAQSGAGPEDVD
eukprot:12141174-Karenia_brevis.AAC.1